MTKPIPTKEPLTITAGDYVQWKRSFSDYPASTWTLSYALVNNDSGTIEFTAAASGADHLITLPVSETTGYEEGIYKWQAYVTCGSQRVTVGTGEIEILPNFATVGNYETRSHVKIVLDAIEAVIEGRATKDQEEYQIGSRRLKRTSIPDLLILRDKYKALYLSEQNAEKVKNGSSAKNRIFVRI